MKKYLVMMLTVLMVGNHLHAQMEPAAGNWRTWFITSGKSYRLAAPPSSQKEIAEVVVAQENIDSSQWQDIKYWNCGSPGYHWEEMIGKLWIYDTSARAAGALSYMLLNVAIYDATIVAWDTKYAYKRQRPFAASSKIKLFAINPQSPSYPCEYAVAAGAAVTILSHFYPSLTDSVNHMAARLMASRIAAGTAFPSDVRAGFELGRQIAQKEIEYTKDFLVKKTWDGKVPQQAGIWRGKYPLFPLAGLNKTVVLDSGSQFRPPPPPDFAKDMEELKKFKQNFGSQSNAFFWASQPFWGDVLDKEIFEHNLHLNPPRAARLYAITAVSTYDGFISCWDAKYAYWGIRPNQYDTTYHSLVPTPPFPGYPSGHAAISGDIGELFSYFFPEDAPYFRQKAKEAAESRFQAGIHFRTDNEVGLELGRKVARAVIEKVKTDGADEPPQFTSRKQ